MGIKLSFKGIDPKELQKAVEQVQRTEILVGIPQGSAERDDDKSVNNAELAAWHEAGDPSRRLPARPFMQTGVDRAAEKINAAMALATAAVISGETDISEYAEMAGAAAEASIKDVFIHNDWKPLSPRTIQERAYKRAAKKKGFANLSEEKQEKAIEAEIEAMGYARPLIDTGSLQGSIKHVIVHNGGGE